MEAAVKPAICEWCGELMDGRPCTGLLAVVEGIAYYRITYDDGESLLCRDCNTLIGTLRQAAAYAAAVRAAESPDARRASCRPA